MGIVLITISGIVGALFSLGYKWNASRSMRTNDLLILMATVGSLLSLACMALFGEWVMPRAALVMGVPQGVTSFVAVHLFFLVTRRNRLNVSWTIIQFYVVVPFLVSLLVFRDSFTLRGGAGVILILASIVLFGRTSRTATEVRPDAKTVFFLLAATLLSGISNTMPKVYTSVTADHPTFPLVLVVNLAFLLAAVSVSLTRRLASAPRRQLPAPAAPAVTLANTGPPTPTSHAPTIPSMLSPDNRRRDSLVGAAIAAWMGFWQLCSAASLVFGLSILPGTVAYPLRIVSNIVGVVLLSRLLFGERMSRSEWAGTTVAIAGVALVASTV